MYVYIYIYMYISSVYGFVYVYCVLCLFTLTQIVFSVKHVFYCGISITGVLLWNIIRQRNNNNNNINNMNINSNSNIIV